MDLQKYHELDVIIICGLPGSGKSHFARTYFKETDRARINRTEIRRFLYEMTCFGDKWLEKYYDEHDEMLVKHVERRVYEHFIHNRKKVLIDNTSITKSSRKTYVDIAHHINKSIGVIFLNTPVQKCMKRNQSNIDPIPDIVISNLYATIELPERDEGFKEILSINDY